MSARTAEPTSEKEASPVSGNIVVAGVGGQGVIMASNVIAQVLLDAGFDVKKSEVHGMSQRGGTVVSHVRFGHDVHSVTVEPGTADWVVAFEWEEGLRALPYLADEGVAFVSTERRLPPASMSDHRGGALAYPAADASPRGVVAIDTAAVAGDAAATRAAVAQTVLLGAVAARLPFPAEAWHTAIRSWVPPKTVEENITAFERGRAHKPASPTRLRQAPVVARPPALVSIEAAWCKGCNICVAVCPERCLELDRFDVAVFAHPERCTGCQLCSWLCPDLAIDVSYQAQEEHVHAAAGPR